MACAPGSDQSFGPRVNIECRPFDFTLLFEDVVFSCIPAALLLVSAPIYITLLLRRPKRLLIRLCSLAYQANIWSLFSVEAVILGLRIHDVRFQTQASIAADCLLLLAIATLGVSAIIEHDRFVRPSALVSLFWSATALLSIAKVRTAWLIAPDEGVSAASTALCILLGFAVVLQVYRKPVPGISEKHSDSIESQSNFWERVAFAWLLETLRTGYNRILSPEDLPMLDAKLCSNILHQGLQSTWTPKAAAKRPSLIRATARQCTWSFLSAVLPRLALTAFTFAQPFLISTTVEYIGEVQPNETYGKALVGAWTLVFLGLAASTAVYNYQNARFMIRVRGSLLGLIYDHTLKARAIDLGDVTAVAVMGTDVERIFAGTRSIHASWSALLDIGIATWLLYRQLGGACAAPIIITLVFMGIGAALSGSSNVAQRLWIEKVQARLRVTTALLDDIKAVQMQGLSQKMKFLIADLRHQEIKGSEKFRKLLTVIASLSISLLSLAPVATFLVYAIIALVSKQETLLSAQAFTSVALITLLTTPVLMFIQAFPSIIQCKACFERIEKFCNYSAGLEHPTNPEVEQQTSDGIVLSTVTPKVPSGVRTPNGGELFSVNAQSFWWDRSKDAILRNVQLSIRSQQVTAIVGAVGSGKSTLLAGLLGEAFTSVATLGERHLPAVAYCSQEPWLETVSVQKNIIGSDPFEAKWYETVIDACGLGPDLAIQPKGDQTVVSSKGLNLSGGQKQRIALARAVYSRHDVVFLDDVFSGMDASTVAKVSRALLGRDGLLRKAAFSVVVVTHNRNVVALADSVISIEDGRLTESRAPPTLPTEALGSGQDMPYLYDDHQIATAESAVHPKPRPSLSRSEEEEDVANDVSRMKGDLSVYAYYVKRSGYLVVAAYVIIMSIGEFCTEFPTVWLKWWSEANAAHPNDRIGMYMGVYAAIGLVASICSCYSLWVMAVHMISNSALALHADLLDTVVRAPFRFFTSTNTGSITNRFGEDMELIGFAMPLDLANYISLAVSCLIKLVILMIFGQYLGAAVPLLAAVLFMLQRFYLRTSRQVRLLGIEAKAPLYTTFLESTAGAATIRAFGWQRSYQERAYKLIDNSQKPVYYQMCLQHWLEFMLDLLMTALSVTLIAIVTTWHDKFSAGSVGVALVMVVGFNFTLRLLIINWTRLESSIGAVARVKHFVAHTEAEDSGTGLSCPKEGGWETGSIALHNVIARYRPGTDPVLRDVTLQIQHGEHIAVCGRSGSGKSSLLLALLKMITVEAGSIVMDDINTSTIAGDALRQQMNVVAQDPLLLPGTVRFNIDPSGTVTDSQIDKALQRVKLWDIVEVQGGLDQELDAAAWSVGQKQLLCFARAMVRSSKILLLDEAMSSVDSETEGLMQEIIDTEFKHCTVVAVMHRLDFIDRYDKVAVMGEGHLLEYDDPASLLAGQTRFAALHGSATH